MAGEVLVTLNKNEGRFVLSSKLEGMFVSFKKTSREVNVIFPLINVSPVQPL